MNYLVLLFILLIVIFMLTLKKEKFAWSCTFIPNKDYYKEEWLLGNGTIGERIGDGNIKK